MRKSFIIAALFSMFVLSPAAFAEGANWLKDLLPKPAVEPAATGQVEAGVQPQAPQVPQDIINAQQEAMKRQEEAFEMQRNLQTQDMQRRREAFEAKQQAEQEAFEAKRQAEQEEFNASQKKLRDDFESQQLAKEEAFNAEQKAQEQDMQNQLDAFIALKQYATSYTERMEPQK